MARAWAELGCSYEYHPYDVAKAFNDIVAERYGKGSIKQAVQGLRTTAPWLGVSLPWRKALTFSDVEIAFKKRQEMVTGEMLINGIPGTFVIGSGTIAAHIPEKSHDEVKRLMDDIQKRLETTSIFKGKAMTNLYEFVDPAMLDTGTLVYSKGVLTDLEDHVWTILRDLEGCHSKGVRLQRKVLLSGPFGSGKTMALLKTMQIAVENGWTSIYIEPTIEPSTVIEAVMEHSLKYQPVLITLEDFDAEQRSGNIHLFRHLMTALDGAKSKIGEMLIVMTTNHPNELSAGLVRPGRIDKVIEFGKFESEDAIKLLKILIQESDLAEDINWETVGKACSGFMPAFVNGVAEGAKLPAIRQNCKVTEEMLVGAAQGLSIQYKKCMEVKTGFTAGDD